MQPLSFSLNLPITENCQNFSCCIPQRKKSKPIDIPDVKAKHDNLMKELMQKALFFKKKT